MARTCFTLKSILFGLLGGLAVCFAAYPNDYMVKSNLFVGTNLPFGVFCLLFLVNLLFRPFAGRLPRFFRFSNGELVVSIVIMLAACSLPTSGLMRYFPQVLTCPYDLYSTRQNWQTHQVLKYAPDHVVPEGWYIEGENPELDSTMDGAERRERLDQAEEVNKGFRNGITKGTRFVQFWSTGEDDKVIPLKSWLKPLCFWGPLIVLFLVFMCTMMVIVHPQWSRNELLPYPIAEFTTEMLHVEAGERFPKMWKQRMFWVAFALVAVVHLVRVYHVWYPETMVNIKLEWRLHGVIARCFPDFYYHSHGSYRVFSNKLYLGVIGFAFFIPTDASFSLGLTQIALAFFSYFMWTCGVTYTSYHHNTVLFGAYLGMFLMVLYLGRNYYWSVFRAACGGSRRGREVDDSVVWAARVFLGSYLGMILLCCLSGLNVWLSACFVTSLGILYLGLARVSAESGSPLVQANWKPADIFLKIFGATALGPYSLAVMGLLTTALGSDPREALSCFLTNGFKVAESEKINNFRLARTAFAAMLPCVVLAFLMALWVNYNGRGSDSYALTWPPRRTFDRVADAVAEIAREPGMLAKVEGLERSEGAFSFSGFAFRMRHWSVRPGVLPWLIFGMCAVFFSYLMRLRFTWWMIHPVLFLTWGVWASICFCHSFLVGFLIKTVVVKYGGGRMYHNLKPFFMGAIMGEAFIACAIMIFNVWYYFHFGCIQPKRYFIFPV